VTPPPVDLYARGTPLHRVDRLGERLGLAPGRLWMKRDDLTGLAGGGNKARKLEFLVADALAQGCNTLITSGALQSNHVRMTAAAAARHGMACHGVIYGPPPERTQGNLVLDDLLGLAAHVVAHRDDVPDRIARVTDRLSSSGAAPYVIPGGGSSAVGAQGYVVAADEIRAAFDTAPLLVCPVGTAGTYAGLVVGCGGYADVMGVDVNAVPGIEGQIAELVATTASVAGRAAPRGSVTLDPGQPEPYGQPTALTMDALRLVATTEGIALDPVYTGRAMAALIAAARTGSLDSNRPIVFVHTGGLPGLFVDAVTPWLEPLAH
jgi:D-cysteine desulfhydrase family pyridoxal phosphate-dependent enzyme